jgi:hypothetical protein
MRRFVYLKTSNLHKYHEFRSIFDQYGIEVLRTPPTFPEAWHESLFRQVGLSPPSQPWGKAAHD